MAFRSTRRLISTWGRMASSQNFNTNAVRRHASPDVLSPLPVLCSQISSEMEKALPLGRMTVPGRGISSATNLPSWHVSPTSSLLTLKQFPNHFADAATRSTSFSTEAKSGSESESKSETSGQEEGNKEEAAEEKREVGEGEEGSALTEALDAMKKELEETKEKVLRAYAEMENVRQRAKRDIDNSRQFAIQDFAKALLDVADNLNRAAAVAAAPPPPTTTTTTGTTSTSSNVPTGSESSVESSSSGSSTSSGASDSEQRLKSLLEGVLMTEKQLQQVFRRFGLENYDPAGSPFDPNLHNAMLEVDDPAKDPGTVTLVFKTGYTLHGRVLRPADVGVVSSRD